MQFRSAVTLAFAAGLAVGCSSPEETGDAEAPEPVATQSPTPTPTTTNTPTDGQPLAEGEWFIEESASGASAAFGPPQTEAVLLIRCDKPTRTLTLTRAGDAEQAQTYTIEAGGQAATLDMEPVGGPLPTLEAEIDPGASVFSGFTEAGGVITMTSPDGEALRVPTAPGISRVFEACS